ncbi:uncharacterized protein LOC106453858 [Brassica napus]|uniref:uncharacterized protein LOC106453858 n=1 Tax=Brassica napus TaxID=3708 RepID=UPI0006AB6F1E|nr:uncharacterized protein LOC106453858 [Brassica napus]
MRNMFRMKLDFNTSYRALLSAQELVRGTTEDGYANLYSYFRQIEISNPGTVTCLEKDGENKFKYIFLSFGVSIAGFTYRRRVIVVDGTHLCGKYEGVMLVAAVQDVSDMHGSIKKACEKVFPWARREICYYHLQQNIVQKFKENHMLYLVKGAAYEHTLFDFNRYMDEIRSINPNLETYLENADVSLWSRIQFQGDIYNIKTSNIAESINSALKPAKGFPVSFLLEFIREKLGRWFFKRREDALSLTSHHNRGVENVLAIREERCQCGVFDIEKIPCSHAIAAAKDANIHVSTLVCPSYSKNYLYEAYAANLYPKSDVLESPNTDGTSPANEEGAPNTDDTSPANEECSNAHKCLPPDVKRGPGRQKKSRWQFWLEISRMRENKPRKLHKDYSCS